LSCLLVGIESVKYAWQAGWWRGAKCKSSLCKGALLETSSGSVASVDTLAGAALRVDFVLLRCRGVVEWSASLDARILSLPCAAPGLLAWGGGRVSSVLGFCSNIGL
jgi:hypothetical protein